MKTQNQALIWMDQQQGKELNYDGLWGAQCLDLIRFYVRFLGEPQFGPTPAAVRLWDTSWPPGFRKIDRPVAGAIAVWDEKLAAGFGHCSLVRRVIDDYNFTSLDQNYLNFNLEKGSPAALVDHSMKNIKGFILPEFLPEPEAVTTPPASVARGKYLMRPGDNFWALEESHGWPHDTLRRLNPNLNPREVPVNYAINIPDPNPQPTAPLPTDKKYQIRAGDTFWDLEESNGWNHGTLVQMNPSVNPRMLHIGQYINVPK